MAGRLLALVYLLCVLAPGISFAFDDGARVAHCLTDENHGLGIMHVHEQGEGTEHHIQKDGHAHSRSQADIGPTTNHAVAQSASNEAFSPASVPHKTSGNQCCGLVSLSALPATLTEIIQPPALTSLRVSEVYRSLAGKAPSSLYRPPIS